jgi:hypothetical protein
MLYCQTLKEVTMESVAVIDSNWHIIHTVTGHQRSALLYLQTSADVCWQMLCKPITKSISVALKRAHVENTRACILPNTRLQHVSSIYWQRANTELRIKLVAIFFLYITGHLLTSQVDDDDDVDLWAISVHIQLHLIMFVPRRCVVWLSFLKYISNPVRLHV